LEVEFDSLTCVTDEVIPGGGAGRVYVVVVAQS
jgi:hypothetical protein